MTKPTAAGILEAGLKHMQDRASTYDQPAGERSMGRTVAAFNAITGHGLSEEQGWLLLGLLKMVRSQQGALKLDNYEDEAAYAALRGECAARERAPGLIRRASHPMTPNVLEFDEARIDRIASSHGDGEHYAEVEECTCGPQEACNNCQRTEPQRPRHVCATCSQGHATHNCKAGLGGER